LPQEQHIILHTPIQLVFSRDAMLNVKFEADWQLIKQLKQKQINVNNQRENNKKILTNTKLETKYCILYNLKENIQKILIKGHMK